MIVEDAKMKQLIKAAPRSFSDLISLLDVGLGWPLYDATFVAEDVLLDWSPEELHLDPDQVARLVGISQIPPLTAKQTFGAFYLRFEGGQLPIGAIRRLVQRLVTSKRGRGSGTVPTWALNDLLFFCIAAGGEHLIHIVNFRERDGRRELNVLTWSENPTDRRLALLARRTAAELAWEGDEGPRFVTDPNVLTKVVGYREGIKSAKVLSKRMAEVAQDVRDEVKALLDVETDAGPMRSLFKDVQERLIGDIKPERFADVYAQTMVYGLLTARIAHPEQFKAERSVAVIKFDNEFLDAIYARFRDEVDGVIDIDELGLADLAEQLADTNVDELLADFGADNQRDDPVVYFYEEFLAQYDPQQRKDLGAFYTPKPVVRYIVKTVDDALKSFGLSRGVADSTTWGEYVKTHPGIEIPSSVSSTDSVVSMFDPANGTGTFLVEWLERAKQNAGTAGVASALHQASALEISLASYAVSHLKVSLELPGGLREKARLPIFLGDTLGPRRVARLKGMDDPVGIEGVLANEVKFDRHHNVLIGNPPYDRVESAGTGGFITAPMPGSSRSLFDDILDDAKANTVFSHHASLYNLYVYFWRWGIWKVFEENTGPGVVSMITASSWLNGPGTIGLRRLAREVADEITVLDLHGDGQGTLKDENVFNIKSPVAIVTLIRRGRGDRAKPAPVRYASLWGSRTAKLSRLSDIAAGHGALETENAADAWFAPFVPARGGSSWQEFPALFDLIPWQQPGCKFGRTWPNNPSREVLEARWTTLVAANELASRAEMFITPTSGRHIYSKVSGLARIADAKQGDPHPPIRRYAYRSFDRQWAFDDPRMAKTESPSLWASLSERQVFMATLASYPVGPGPAATVSTAVPDMAVYRGSFGGKDVLPLYRDAEGTPNADPALLKAIRMRHQAADPAAPDVTPERLFAYIYGLLASADYTTRFKAALGTPGPRVPVTADPMLFAEMVELGERILWLQTFGERFVPNAAAFPPPAATWEPEPTRPPDDKSEIAFDAGRSVLRVADGVLRGISAEVYSFEVSGMVVIPKWLGYRMAKPGGRAASSKSPLDAMRATTWPSEWSQELIEIVTVLEETLKAQPAGVALLDQIVDGPLIHATDLPQPPAWMRQPPKANGLHDSALFSAEELG